MGTGGRPPGRALPRSGRVRRFPQARLRGMVTRETPTAHGADTEHTDSRTTSHRREAMELS